MRRALPLLALAGLLPAAPPLPAAETEIVLLSGRGPADAVEWEFRIDRGRRDGERGTLPVPSCWEMHGFGELTYGVGHEGHPGEIGRYRHRFAVPARWAGRRVELVFDGVLTDATVWVNGQLAGPTHRGGFTRFAHDVSGLLRVPGPNLLEVEVRERSAEPSVNRAERDADYWTFGGIHRPVWLRATPRAAIAHVAADPRHDGRLDVAVELAPGPRPAVDLVRGRVETLAEEPVGRPFAALVPRAASSVSLRTVIPDVAPWSAETPRLYRLRLELLAGGRVVHRVEQRIGFRTVELRPGEGLFVNGTRVRLRGINRHVFSPTTGRAVDAELSRRDAERLVAMNLDAVRTSHYPAEEAFLDAADELGLYVVAELPGWHDAYREGIGKRLAGEMIRRDGHHPSIVLWSHGNERGWNPRTDAAFARHDPQRRPVLHPDSHAPWRGLDSRHYPTWRELTDRLAGSEAKLRLHRLLGEPPALVLPTEMLHGLYDGGGGASLADFWHALRTSPRGVGFFLWSYLDEGVRREKGIDTAGNRAPDGIADPWRAPEASVATLREVLSPVQLEAAPGGAAAGRLRVENRYHHVGLAEYTARWRLLAFPPPDGAGPPTATASGEVPLPPLPPGERGRLDLALPAAAAAAAGALEVDVRSPAGRLLTRRSWPLSGLGDWQRRLAGAGAVRAEVTDGAARLVADGVEVELDAATGALRRLRLAGRPIPLETPRWAGSDAPATAARVSAGAGALEIAMDGPLALLRWRAAGRGAVELSWQLTAGAGGPHPGLLLPLPEAAVRAQRWLGDGPARVWANRREGVRIGVWELAANDTVTGVRGPYPESDGYFAGVRWWRLETDFGPLVIAPDAAHPFLLSFPPPPWPDPERATAPFPPRGLAVLAAIPAIGTKFAMPAELGPTAAAAGRQAPPRQGSVLLWVPEQAATVIGPAVP